MRYLAMIIGAALLVAGIWAVTTQPSFRTNETVTHIGPITVTRANDKPLPEWVGIGGIVVGGIIVLAGLSVRRRH